MAVTTIIKSVQTLIAAGTTNAASGTTRGTVDLRTANGGMLTFKVSNSGTLGTQAVVNILAAHNVGATPAASAAGTDWKTLYSVGNGTINGTVGEWNFNVPSGIMHLEVEVTGNTTAAVVCEAFLSRTDSASSV